MPADPHENAFVLDVSAAGTTVQRRASFDIYQPAGPVRPLPAVVFVPGPVAAASKTRPRDWPLFQGYGRLAASRGLAGVVVDQAYHSPDDWAEAATELNAIVDAVREIDEIDADRVAVWAFSGGGLLVGDWLADSPPWLRCLALTYPVMHGPGSEVDQVDRVRPGRAVVLTRVGRERPEIQQTVDHFLGRAAATGTVVQLIDVPEGQHGFDLLDHTAQSRQAVVDAMDAVERHVAVADAGAELSAFMAAYEAATNSHDFDHIAPLVAPDATYWFSDGSHHGIDAIRAAIERTFATIRDEVYEIRDVEWITQTADTAVCRYRFSWRGVVDGEPKSGTGRGTNVVTKRRGEWQMLHEHLSS